MAWGESLELEKILVNWYVIYCSQRQKLSVSKVVEMLNRFQRSHGVQPRNFFFE